MVKKKTRKIISTKIRLVLQAFFVLQNIHNRQPLSFSDRRLLPQFA
ncbi:hypothetical protein S2E19_01721 [Bacillus mycoides]|nr:hypothetical protein S2E19_01721 [Bacillus mycoides]